MRDIYGPFPEISSDRIIEDALQSAAYASRVSTNNTLGVSPGALVFHRDMLLNIPIISDLHLIHQKRQDIVDRNNIRENVRRRQHDYAVGQRVSVLEFNPGKLEPRKTGPYVIKQVHTNGNVTIRRLPTVIERINIRRVRPYRD